MSGRRVPILLAVALVGGLIALEIATSGGGDGSDRAAAPALPTAVLVPPAVTLESLRGKPAVVNFWASWCTPCKKEAGHLKQLSERLRGRAALVGVNFTDNLSGARKFIGAYGWRFPNLRDADGDVGSAYFSKTHSVEGLPITFVLDADGRIARVLHGPQTVDQFEAAVRDAASD